MDHERRTRPEQLIADERRRELKEAMRTALHENGAASKALVKEAIKEWLDEKYAAAARWSLSWILVACIGLIGYALLWKAGWSPPK